MSRRVGMLVSSACTADRRVLPEARALAARGHGVTVLARDREGRHPPWEEMDGVEIQRVGAESTFGAGLRRLGQWPAFARQVSACLRQGAWDVVHSHDLDTWPIGYGYARRRDLLLLLDAHESYPDLLARYLPGPAVVALRMFDRFLVRRADAQITVGQLLGAHYRRWAQRVVVRSCPPAVAAPSVQRSLCQEWGLGSMDAALRGDLPPSAQTWCVVTTRLTYC